jgi:hypothetical protein
MADKKSSKKTSSDEKTNFWTTLPGIVTAITGLIVAITGLIAVLGENGLLAQWQNQQATAIAATALPTEFATTTPIDSDVTLEPLSTQEATPVSGGAPTCSDFSMFTGTSNPNGVVVAYNGGQAWVGYGSLPLEAADQYQAALLFDTSPEAADCLRAYLQYLGSDHTFTWPTADDGNGREINAVWLSSAQPPQVGDFANWEDLPDHLVITVVNETFNPQFTGYYECGADIPPAARAHIAFWHAGTSAEAVQGYLDLYSSNGYELAAPVDCATP